MSKFDASAFRSQLVGDVARPNLHRVTVIFPEGNGINEKFQFQCRSSQIPGFVIGTIQVPYFGRMVKFAGDRVVEDFAVRVIQDEDYKIRRAFEAWQNRLDLIGHGTTRKERHDTLAVYADVFVEHFGKDGEVIATYKLLNAFPSVIEPISLDWEMNDTAAEYGVVFTCDQVIPDGLASQFTELSQI
jgi:hypothetical protein